MSHSDEQMKIEQDRNAHEIMQRFSIQGAPARCVSTADPFFISDSTLEELSEALNRCNDAFEPGEWLDGPWPKVKQPWYRRLCNWLWEEIGGGCAS